MGIYTDRDLIDILAELQHRFTHNGNSESVINPLERYHYFARHSEHRKKCVYALKSRELFLRHDFDTVMKLVCEAADLYRDTMAGKPPELFPQFPPEENEEDAD